MNRSEPNVTDMPIWFWLLIAAVLLSQSAWLFIDARKRESYPWLWGLWGLIQFPMPLLVYAVVVRKALRRSRK